MSDLKEKLKARRKEIANRQGGSVIFPKEGTLRFRVLPTGEEDWAMEMTYFYLGDEVKGIYSPATFEKPCPVMELYNKLKVGAEEMKEIAKLLVPRKKYLVPVMTYTDTKGKNVDEGQSGRLLQVPNRVYAQMIDYYLDSEYPEFNDPEDGFDFELKREGTKLTNTSYSIMIKPPKPMVDKKFKKVVDVKEMAEKTVRSYDELEQNLVQFLEEENVDLSKLGLASGETKKKKKKKKKTDV